MDKHNAPKMLHGAPYEMPLSTVTGSTITIDRQDAVVNLSSATAETRTLAIPTAAGIRCRLHMQVDGGDITLTVASAYNEDGDTTFVFSDVGQHLDLESFQTTGGVYFWRKTGDHNSANLFDGTGTAAFTARVTTTDGVSSGTARVVGGLAYSNTAASTAITGTTATEQLFDSSYTIPANTLKAGSVVKVRVQGIATTTSSTDTIAYKLYIGGSGGTALVSVAATNATDADTFLMEDQIVCRTAGTTGTIVAVGTYKVSSAEGTMTVKDDILGSTTLNTQQNNAIVVTGTWSVANACNSCRVDILTVEIY